MPGNVKNTLYPPLPIYTFMPAFSVRSVSIDGAEKWQGVGSIEFSISPYNSRNDFSKIHVIVVDSESNMNALEDPSGVLIKKTSELIYNKNTDTYSIDISSEDMLDGSFKVDNYYKVQVRFDNSTASETSTDYLTKERDSFSEWSSIILIKPVPEPTVQLANFDVDEGDAPRGFSRGIIPVSGYVSFGSSSTEHLQSYVISILDADGEVLLSTPTIYTGANIAPNEISYKLDVQGIENSAGDALTLRIDYLTNNQLSFSSEHQFSIYEYAEDDTFVPEIDVQLYQEDGLVRLRITNNLNVSGIIHIKRASSRDNYRVWEHFYSQAVTGELNIDVIDNTVASMTWYQYSVQLEKSNSNFTPVFRSDKVFNDFFDANLSRDDKQIALRYNFSISSMKPVVNRVKIDTLGGKYPRFLENAHLRYKQMSISGLISSTMDELDLFMNKKQYFGKDYPNYNLYNEQQDIKEEYDYLWEREFRENLVEWLNDGEPKLFRSMTEGNIVVMLSDVSLTPNRTLSRMLYDFSATAYEVAEGYSLETLETLGIFTTNYASTSSSSTGGTSDSGDTSGDATNVSTQKIGQLYEITNGVDYDLNSDVVVYIHNELQKRYSGILSNLTPVDSVLKDVKIQFTSQPNLYVEDDDELIEYDVEAHSTVPQEDVLIGYKIRINNGKSIFVNSKGYRQIQSDIDVKSLYVYGENTRFTFDYTIEYRESATASKTPEYTTLERKIFGQEYGPFMAGEYIEQRISDKYDYQVVDEAGTVITSSRLSTWTGVIFDVDPFTVVSVQLKQGGVYEDLYIGETGVLDLRDFRCYDICFKGVLMTAVDSSRINFLDRNECVDYTSQATYTSSLDISSPQEKGIYKIGSVTKIYYSGDWYDAVKSGTQWLCGIPVDGSVNYIGSLLKEKF